MTLFMVENKKIKSHSDQAVGAGCFVDLSCNELRIFQFHPCRKNLV